jgi:hypothetical protein
MLSHDVLTLKRHDSYLERHAQSLMVSHDVLTLKSSDASDAELSDASDAVS